MGELPACGPTLFAPSFLTTGAGLEAKGSTPPARSTTAPRRACCGAAWPRGSGALARGSALRIIAPVGHGLPSSIIAACAAMGDVMNLPWCQSVKDVRVSAMEAPRAATSPVRRPALRPRGELAHRTNIGTNDQTDSQLSSSRRAHSSHCEQTEQRLRTAAHWPRGRHEALVFPARHQHAAAAGQAHADAEPGEAQGGPGRSAGLGCEC
jgi:hypothetical protein